jgi:hypothetical protein
MSTPTASSPDSSAPLPADPAGTADSPRPVPATGGTPFQERLLPSVGTWMVLAVAGGALGLILVPVSSALAAVVAVVCIALAIVLGFATSPVVSVAGGMLTMGRSRIPVQELGEPEVLTGQDWHHAMHEGFEPLAHHVTRGWIHSGLRVPVIDEEDPVTAWVVSCRRPEDLSLALRAAQKA